MNATDYLSEMGRVAVYYAPEPDDPLWAAGCAWLGRDALSGASVAQPDLPGLRAATGSARVYGFHATLKAPFRPVAGVGVAELVARLERLAAGLAPIALPALRVGRLDRYLALLEAAPSMALRALADLVVAGLEEVRAPLTEAELARRRGPGLGAEREALLLRYGYPDVFASWRFHMTLGGPLSDAAAEGYRPAAEAFFSAALAMPRVVRALCVFVQAEQGAAFRLVARVPFGGFDRAGLQT